MQPFIGVYRLRTRVKKETIETKFNAIFGSLIFDLGNKCIKRNDVRALNFIYIHDSHTYSFHIVMNCIVFGLVTMWLNQHTVSSGAFVFAENELFVNVLFVTDSPIDGKPWDELECCGPFVVLAVLRITFAHQNRLTAISTYQKLFLLFIAIFFLNLFNVKIYNSI